MCRLRRQALQRRGATTCYEEQSMQCNDCLGTSSFMVTLFYGGYRPVMKEPVW